MSDLTAVLIGGGAGLWTMLWWYLGFREGRRWERFDSKRTWGG